MTESTTPTLTLAKLYESQAQFIDALVIYEQLLETEPSDKIRQKIEELKNQIFTQHHSEYSDLINQIFSAEEKRLFHILPHNLLKTYKEAKEQNKPGIHEVFEKIPEVETELISPLRSEEETTPTDVKEKSTQETTEITAEEEKTEEIKESSVLTMKELLPTESSPKTDKEASKPKETLNLEDYNSIVKRFEESNNFSELMGKIKDVDIVKLKSILNKKSGKPIKMDEIKLSDLFEAVELIKKLDNENRKDK